MLDIIKPKCPDNADWSRVKLPASSPVMCMGYTVNAWLHKDGYFVLSAVEAPEAQKLGPEYHLSVSKSGGRCSSAEGLWICHEFGIPEADEDNHVGGISRHYWRPVADNLADYSCPCKDEETAIVEDKGDFIWRPLA